ncbi:(R)-specific enoyl-CoA hydratase [uncultured Eubacterium sp.]|nr:(R)-specific enoyl-CoA hydratase [uncultured Eubacterium sp.]
MGLSNSLIIDKSMELKVGDSASITQKATTMLVEKYGQVSGDYNPVHFDDQYAKTLGFDGRMMHGLFCMGMISYLVGTVMPGQGAIFIDEEVRYVRPVYIDDEITATVRILSVNSEKKRLEVGFICKNQCDLVVMQGKTRVLCKLV